MKDSYSNAVTVIENKTNDIYRRLLSYIKEKAYISFYLYRKIYLFFVLNFILFFYVGCCLSCRAYIMHDISATFTAMPVTLILTVLYFCGYTIFGKFISSVSCAFYAIVAGIYCYNVSILNTSIQSILIIALLSILVILLLSMVNIYSEIAIAGKRYKLSDRRTARYTICYTLIACLVSLILNF